MILTLTAITEMKSNLDQFLNAVTMASNLTGFMIGTVKYTESVPVNIKREMLEHLIKIHNRTPLSTSDEIVKECQELLNRLSL